MLKCCLHQGLFHRDQTYLEGEYSLPSKPKKKASTRPGFSIKNIFTIFPSQCKNYQLSLISMTCLHKLLMVYIDSNVITLWS